MSGAHIKIARKAFAEDVWWKEPRCFSKWEAWEHLISLAQFRAYTHVTEYGPVALERGELLASLRWLGDRWQWSTKKVTGFLKMAERIGRVRKQRETRSGFVYLVVNYDTYQGRIQSQETAEETAEETARKQRGNKNKQVKQEKAVNLSPLADATEGGGGLRLDPPQGETATPKFSLAPYAELHLEFFPGSTIPGARYGAAFKRLEAKHGSAETLRRWRICLDRKRTFATPEELGAHWSEYDSATAPASSTNPAEEMAAKVRLAYGHVETRRQARDGPEWWKQMQEAARTNGARTDRDVLFYAYRQLKNGAAA